MKIATKKYQAHDAFAKFKNYIENLSGNKEVAQGSLIEPMAKLCEQYGLREVYYCVMQAYWDEQGYNSDIDQSEKAAKPTALTPEQQAIEPLKDYCEENYDNGCDTLVECWTDEQFIDLLSQSNGSLDVALEHIKILASVYSERQADADFHRKQAS